MDDQQAVKSVKKWINEFIIPNNVCPFAYKEIQNKTTRFIVKQHNSIEDTLFNIINELTQLDKELETNTSLFIINQGVDDFDAFLDLVSLANALLEKQNYAGVYQLASFHPQYQFENTKQDAAENFSNRAPCPVIHILRETAVELAVKQHIDVHQIPKDNIKRLNEIGFKKLKGDLTKLIDIKF